MNILKVRKRKEKGQKGKERKEKRKHGIHLKEGRKKWREEGNETQYGMHFNLSFHLPSSGPGISCWPSVLAIPTSKQHHTCTTRPHIIPGCPDHSQHLILVTASTL